MEDIIHRHPEIQHQEDEDDQPLPMSHQDSEDEDGSEENEQAEEPLLQNASRRRRRRDEPALPLANVIISVFFGYFWKWFILLLLCSGALFFFTITPSFTLHSATSSVLNNITTTASASAQNHFTANFTVKILIHDSKWMGFLSARRIYYNDSFRASLFDRQENLTTLSLPISSQPSENFTVKAEFPNVPLELDDWYIFGGHGCGYVFLDLNLTTEALYTLALIPIAREKLQSQWGEVKFKLCFSSSPSSSSVNTTTVVNPVSAGCHVDSDAVAKIRLVQLVILTIVLAVVLGVPYLAYVISGFYGQ